GNHTRQLARAGTDTLEMVERNQRRRIVDRIHDVVQRSREQMDVLAVDRCDERLVEALDDVVREEVALVLDFLHLVRAIRQWRVDREHLIEQPRTRANLVRESDEIGEESFLTGDETESHLCCLLSEAREFYGDVMSM